MNDRQNIIHVVFSAKGYSSFPATANGIVIDFRRNLARITMVAAQLTLHIILDKP